jgi:hypothetical protein
LYIQSFILIKETYEGETKMPQLVKGGKWAYGWVVVGPKGELIIPPEAWREYKFQAGEETVFTPGSRRSGGFGLSTPKLMAVISERFEGGEFRTLGRGRFDEERKTMVPSEVGVKSGDRLLAVRGSRYGLGFVAQGPIYEEALKHPNLEIFSKP